MASDLRQRKGGEDAKISEMRSRMEKAAKEQNFEEASRLKKAIDKAEGGDSVAVSSSDKLDGEDAAMELISKLKDQVMQETPGLTHEEQKHKDALDKDPYNMELIYNLGLAYSQENRWDKAEIVMMRGLMRTSALEDPVHRVHFLVILCEASFVNQKYQQAKHVLNKVLEEMGKMDDPVHDPRIVETLKCKVYLMNKEVDIGLKAFNEAIKDAPWDEVQKVWAQCAPFLKEANLHDPVKEKLEKLAPNEDEKKKVGMISTLADVRRQFSIMKRGGQQSSIFSLKSGGKFLLVALCLVCFFYFLYQMESRSLSKLQLKGKN